MRKHIMHPRHCGKTQNIGAEVITTIIEFKKNISRQREMVDLIFNTFMTMDLSNSTQGFLTNNPFLIEGDIKDALVGCFNYRDKV